MTTATAPLGLYQAGTKAAIMDTGEALFRAAGVQWRPGRMAKHIGRELSRNGINAACLFVIDEMTDIGVNVTWSRRDFVGMIDPTGQYAASRADVMHASRLMARGDLEGANSVLDNKKNAPTVWQDREGEVKELETHK